MDKDRCVQQLLAWFGNREFRVRDLDEDKVRELRALMGLASSNNNIGNRSQLGLSLSELQGHAYQLLGNRICTFRIVSNADQSVPAVYQIT